MSSSNDEIEMLNTNKPKEVKAKDDDDSSDSEESNTHRGSDPLKRKKDHSHLNNRQKMFHYFRKQKWFLLFMFIVALIFVLGGIFLWQHFSWAAWYAIWILWFTFGMLIKNKWDPAISMMISLTLLLVAEIITPREAAAGFGDTLVLAIGALYVVAVGIEHSGALLYLNKYVLGKSKRIWVAIARLMIPTAIISGFVNNTPLVAMMIPAVERWSRETGISPSKLMIPLSYASIVGNFSIIATSPNLVVIALAQRFDPSLQFPFFEPGIVGVPIMIIAWLYMIPLGNWLLPVRKAAASDYVKDPKSYHIALTVSAGSPVVGRTVEEAGLRHLPGIYLVEIDRSGETLPAASHDTHIFAGDVLFFAGDTSKVNEVLRIPGLSVNTQSGDVLKSVPGRILVEAFVGPRNPNLGKKISSCNFRDQYNAAVISVYREGEQIKGRIGDIRLHRGDSLLMVARPKFVEKYNGSGDFIYVAPVGDAVIHTDKNRMFMAIAFALSLYVITALEWVDLLTISLVAAFSLYITRCVTFRQLKDSIDMSVLIVIAASFSTAVSLEKTGVAATWAQNLLDGTSWGGTYGILYGTYLATTLLTALLSNVSAAAIMVPVVFGLQGAAPIKALLYVVMHGASADFSTPIGYQTNLMVWGPGGYKFHDYARVGIPLQALASIVTVTVSWAAFK